MQRTARTMIPFIAMLLLSPRMAASQEQRTVTVTGQAEHSVPPDMVVFRAGVQARTSDLAGARRQMEEGSRTLLAALKGAGVAERDIQTGYLSIQPDYRMQGREQLLVGFNAQQTFSITVRHLTGWEDVLAAVLDAGATDVSGPSYRLADPSRLEDAVRDAAIQEALRKARRMAEVLGARLGPALHVEEIGGGSPAPVGDVMMMRSAESAGPFTSQGEITVRASVRVLFVLESGR